MGPETWQRLEALFLQAIALPPSERMALLDEACRGQAALRGELEAMLAVHETGTLAADARGLLPSLRGASPSLQVGDEVGPYRLEEVLGRGGMGEVFRAVRRDDLHQEVAIKVVRPERATPELTLRFLQERRIIAQLDHPGIATFLDGGLAPDGQPYLVMQYVKGQPITRYADERRLSIPERLRLFVQVCEAVQFAHGRLVVHRDLKPSNILVGGDGRPRLLDFGIAKLLDAAAAGSTTGDLLLLTPEHAAPEQFLGNPVTTATDVYALGVLLYQLLTGVRPFEQVAAPDLARAVCEEPPRPPSALVPLHPDLDQVVQMALRKEPERRYASAGQLAEEITRFLGGWPVIAQPDTAGYRFRRFVGRHRVPVAAAVALLTTLVGATVVTVWQSNRRAIALREAEAERTRANRITEFLLGVFRATNPNETRGRTVTARELLDQAASRIQSDSGLEPGTQADLELAIGRAYAFLGLIATADSFVGRAVDARRLGRPDAPLEVAEAVEWLGRIRMTGGQLEEGIRLMQEVVRLREQSLGPDAPELAAPLQRLATATVQLDPYDSTGTARGYFERALRLVRAAKAPDRRTEADVLRHLASLTGDQGRPEEALQLYAEALAAARLATDEDDPFLFNLKESFALGLQQIGLADSAIAIHRDVLAARRRVFGLEHLDVSFSLYNLGRELRRLRRFEEALPLLRECLAMRIRLLGPEHYLVAYATGALAKGLAWSGDVNGGIAGFQRAAVLAERTLGPDSPTALEYLEEVALLQVQAGRYADALATLSTLVGRGYRGIDRDEFQPLRGDPRFRRIQQPAA